MLRITRKLPSAHDCFQVPQSWFTFTCQRQSQCQSQMLPIPNSIETMTCDLTRRARTVLKESNIGWRRYCLVITMAEGG
jgi:hypothetical protein